MRKPTHARERIQPWCLVGLAGSAREVHEAERRLRRTLGHRPSLYEVVEDLMARHQIAAPFTAPSRTPASPDGEPPA